MGLQKFGKNRSTPDNLDNIEEALDKIITLLEDIKAKP